MYNLNEQARSGRFVFFFFKKDRIDHIITFIWNKTEKNINFEEPISPMPKHAYTARYM